MNLTCMWCAGVIWVIKGPVIAGADSLPTPVRVLMMPSGVPPFLPYRRTVTTMVTIERTVDLREPVKKRYSYG